MYKEGQQYGTNILIKKDYEKSQQTKKTYWICKCELCNSIRSIRTDNIYKKCRSCAAKQRNGSQNKYFQVQNDLTNKIFGFWKVIEKSSKTNYWICQCNNCGTIKEVFRGNLIQNTSKSCGCVKSWGEMQIAYLLNYWNINYKKEYTFFDLKTDKNANPRFDFAIFDKNNDLFCLIEYDGRQHFSYDKNWKMSKEDFKRLQYIDNLKIEYCKNNKIPLYHFNNKSFLEEEIKKIIMSIK